MLWFFFCLLSDKFILLDALCFSPVNHLAKIISLHSIYFW